MWLNLLHIDIVNLTTSIFIAKVSTVVDAITDPLLRHTAPITAGELWPSTGPILWQRRQHSSALWGRKKLYVSDVLWYLHGSQKYMVLPCPKIMVLAHTKNKVILVLLLMTQCIFWLITTHIKNQKTPHSLPDTLTSFNASSFGRIGEVYCGTHHSFAHHCCRHSHPSDHRRRASGCSIHWHIQTDATDNASLFQERKTNNMEGWSNVEH